MKQFPKVGDSEPYLNKISMIMIIVRLSPKYRSSWQSYPTCANTCHRIISRLVPVLFKMGSWSRRLPCQKTLTRSFQIREDVLKTLLHCLHKYHAKYSCLFCIFYVSSSGISKKKTNLSSYRLSKISLKGYAGKIIPATIYISPLMFGSISSDQYCIAGLLMGRIWETFYEARGPSDSLSGLDYSKVMCSTWE